MTGEELFRGLGEIDERFIEDARSRARFPRFRAWPRWMAAAGACLVLAGLLRWMPEPGPAVPTVSFAMGVLKGGVTGRTELQLVLRVLERTQDGFTAEVCRTNAKEPAVGMVVFVKLDGVEFPGKADYVCIRVMDYDGDNGIIRADWIDPWDGG